MFKSYVSEVRLSMKFHFIRRRPWGQRHETPGTRLRDASRAGGSLRPARAPVCAAGMPSDSLRGSGTCPSPRTSAEMVKSQALCRVSFGPQHFPALRPPLLSSFSLCSDLRTPPALPVASHRSSLAAFQALPISLLLLLETRSQYMAHSLRWHLSIFFIVFSGHELRFSNCLTHSIGCGKK